MAPSDARASASDRARAEDATRDATGAACESCPEGARRAASWYCAQDEVRATARAVTGRRRARDASTTRGTRARDARRRGAVGEGGASDNDKTTTTNGDVRTTRGDESAREDARDD